MQKVESVKVVPGEYEPMSKVDTPTETIAEANKILAKVVEADGANPFLDEVCSTPGGESIRWCAQCGMCSASCSNVERMDYSPRKTIALIRAGNSHDVLTSNSMWVCASCYLCTVRCPKDVKITELMHTLERLAIHHGLKGKRATPAMYEVFVNSIKSNGRVHELGMMLKFYMSTILTGKVNPFTTIKMLPLALKLFSHGRMVIRPKKIKGTKQIKDIVEKAKALGGVK